MSIIEREFSVVYKAGTLCMWMYGYPSCLLLRINTLYGMLTPRFIVNTFVSSKKINWMTHSVYCDRNGKDSYQLK